MNTRTALNLGLIALMVVLALVVFYEPGHEPPPVVPLTSIEPAAVERIRILRPDEPAIVLERRDAHWRVESKSAQSHAAQSRVDGLLGLLGATSHSRFATQVGELEKYGLAQPWARVRFGEQEIAFGDSEPVNDYRYVQLEDQVHLIADHYSHYLRGTVTAFMSKALLPPAADPVRIVLPDLTLERRPDGGWQLTPERGVSADTVNTFVEAWRHAHALRITEVKETAGAAAVQVDLRSGQSLRFHIAARDPELVLMRQELGLQYHLPEDAVRRLLSLEKPEEAETGAPAAATR